MDAGDSTSSSRSRDGGPLAFALFAVALGAAVFLVFGPGLRHELLPGDLRFVETASSDGASSFGEVIDRVGEVATGEGSVSPVRSWPAAGWFVGVEARLYGHWTAGFRLTGLLLHAIAAILVFLIARRLRVSAAVAAVGALLFVLHPLQVDAVLRPSARGFLLGTVLLLAAFERWVAWRQGGGVGRLLAAGACGLLACGAKLSDSSVALSAAQSALPTSIVKESSGMAVRAVSAKSLSTNRAFSPNRAKMSDSSRSL